MRLGQRDIERFQKVIADYFAAKGRTLPWREIRDPYKIWISEIMLQQTRVPRVLLKYKEFLKKFPKVTDLAKASNSEILSVWIGLGYNNRAIRMRDAAKIIVEKHKAKFPNSFEELLALPGIGSYTAKAILCFAKNIPQVFIETNVRDVFIHHFFKDKSGVNDKEILELVEKTLPKENPRDFYYGLMDYGTFLKSMGKSKLLQSKHYKKQSAFKGSFREKRSKVIKMLLLKPRIEEEIAKELKTESKEVLEALVKDGVIDRKGKKYKIH